MDVVERSYKRFLALATVSYLVFLPDDLQRVQIIQMERAQALIDECLAQEAGMSPAAPVLQVETTIKTEKNEIGETEKHVVFNVFSGDDEETIDVGTTVNDSVTTLGGDRNTVEEVSTLASSQDL